ncbi:DUF202 domain-containing protein [Evansella sp. LMS18]|uniref:YidH family protein n=1 Tax=Evansella sp. LMS18 TaxID=2924033 RepID=UPI0020D0E0F5|nr:DUF202 domain-containing protein [Evansella sp. LMS18]UTR11453.1 DUF202 domain-containing protein [Evansella sp. LMS18]
MTEDNKTNGEKHSVKLAQQHLSNERTYLAWIRTAIAIMGIGFLVTNLHFTFDMEGIQQVDYVINFVGIASIITGIIILIFSTKDYFNKLKQIEQGIFIPSRVSIYILTAFIFVILFVFSFYFIFAMVL